MQNADVPQNMPYQTQMESATNCLRQVRVYRDPSSDQKPYTKTTLPREYSTSKKKNHLNQNNYRSKQDIGTCKIIPKCPSTNSIYWMRTQKCYQKLTRGPCPKGQLLTMDSNKIPACACNKQKEIEVYRASDGKCYQHFTKGPCKEKGHLFLPGKTCGCHSFLPHYHHHTEKCYELGEYGLTLVNVKLTFSYISQQPCVFMMEIQDNFVSLCKISYLLIVSHRH